MANHPSARKRNRQRLKREIRNRHIRSTLRTTLKQARSAIGAGDASVANERTKAAQVALARAVSKGILHARTAARSIGRLQLALNKALQK